MTAPTPTPPSLPAPPAPPIGPGAQLLEEAAAAAAPASGLFAACGAHWWGGESLADALRRGPRPLPTALGLVRDLLSAAEHAHARGVILRRIVPTTLMLELSGRAVITDLRYANWCLPY